MYILTLMPHYGFMRIAVLTHQQASYLLYRENNMLMKYYYLYMFKLKAVRSHYSHQNMQRGYWLTFSLLCYIKNA